MAQTVVHRPKTPYIGRYRGPYWSIARACYIFINYALLQLYDRKKIGARHYIRNTLSFNRFCKGHQGSREGD